MKQFIDRYGDQLLGVLSGFDRLVFRGSLRRLNYGWFDKQAGVFVARGMEEYLWQTEVLMKHYSEHVQRISGLLKATSSRPYNEQKLPVIYLRSASADKEAVARKIAAERQIRIGPVCLLGALEPSPTFEHRGTHIIRRDRPCHVLYHYRIDPVLGWMHARIQTWFPFNIQIAINGREWLTRQMDEAGLKYRQQGNCFVWLENYDQAQILMNRQLEVNWAELLNAFVALLNPMHGEIFRKYTADYYWTCYQSEWTTDLVFRNAAYLKRLMTILVPHGITSFSTSDVMRYFGRKVNHDGTIPGSFPGSVQLDLKHYREGERVKFKLNSNSIKFYDKAYTPFGSVLRAAETTLNNVQDFRVFRPKEGGPDDDLQWRPMRKGIADLNRRAEVSAAANHRLIAALASVDDSRRVEELTAEIQQPAFLGGRRVRALRPWADDRPLLAAIQDGRFLINGFRNRDLQTLLFDQPALCQHEQRRRSAAVSRKLRMLRAHGLIRKIQKTHRYMLTERASVILVAVLTTAQTSVQQLNRLRTAA